MTSKVLFLATFGAGLILAVYSMLQGVERSRASVIRRPSATFNAPTAATFAIILGAAGYLLVTRSALGIPAVLGIAIAIAIAATIGMITLIARWALPYSGMPTEADSIQGQLALVTIPITVGNPGEISFTLNGSRQTLAAESIQGLAISRDTDVVIDSVEDGVARVELWSVVEERL
ncbi:MAG: hypothetical protein ABI875_04470 [Gemmatimonadales bacterium]